MTTTPHRTRLVFPAALVAAIVSVAAPPPAWAQVISGSILESGTGTPLEGVAILALDMDEETRAEAITDGAGRFSLAIPGAAKWVLSVSRLGYHPFDSEPIDIRSADWLVVEITLAAEAIALDPLVVTARRALGSPAIQRFYDRKDAASRSGFGNFLARADIERTSSHRPSDLLRSMSGIRVGRGLAGRGQTVRMTGGCVPAIYIDGMRINRNPNDSVDDFVTVLDIEGIEVYRGPSSQLDQYYDPGGCGLVLVWTRGGFHDPDGKTGWRALLTGLAALGALLLLVK